MNNSTARWRTLWLWGAGVLALHLLVLLNLPLRQSTPLVAQAQAMAHTFTTRTVELPPPTAQAPVPLPATQRSAPAPAKPLALRKTPARPMHRAAAAAAPTAAAAPIAAIAQEAAPASTDADLPFSDPSETVAALHGGLPAAHAKAGLQAASTLVAEAAPEAAANAAPAVPLSTPATPAAQEDKANAPSDAGALAIFAPGADQPLNGPAPAVRVPAPQQLKFDVTGQAKKFQYSARAQLVWQHDGQRYQARQELGIVLLGARTQTSAGSLGPTGLQPERFGDRARSEKAAHFDYAGQRVTFSTNAPDAPLATGTQDRLSVFVQLGALLAAAPERYPPGTRIRLQTAGTSDVDAWTFTVEGEETLELPVGSMNTLRLQRVPRPDHAYDQQAQLWLAPTLGYLPARIRLTQANGDFADLRLISHAAP